MSSLKPSELYESIYKQEKRAKEIKESPELKKNRDLAKELHDLQLSIRKQYRILILEHPVYCQENSRRDVIGLLWKNGFYRQIEDFRRTIKQFKAQFESPNAARMNPQLQEQLKRHVVSLQQDFDSFLTYSVQFFQKLMNELEKKAANLSASETQLNDHFTNSVHRCLLFLGDLSRYQELYAEREQKDFTESVRFYERAALIVPSAGMPHNQLAMLATYNEAESTALYHYCRSIMSQNPFTGGFENMARLFAQNRVSFEQLRTQVQRPHFDQLRSRKPDHTRFKYFLTSFVRLHGLLFAWSLRMHREYVRVFDTEAEATHTQSSTGSAALLSQLNDSLASSVLRANEELDASKLQELIQEVLEELDVQLHQAKLTDLHLLRLVAISIFSVHFAESAETGGADKLRTSDLSSFVQSHSHSLSAEESQASFSQQKMHRSKTQSLALVALFGLVNRVTQRLIHADPHEKNRKVYNDKVLPMLAVFCQWLSQHAVFLSTPTEVEDAPLDAEEEVALPAFFAELSPAASSLVFSSAKQDSPAARWRRRFLCAKEELLTETRARSSLKSVISHFKSSLGDTLASIERSRAPRGEDKHCHLLREHAELRGFLPLGDVFEASFAHFDPLRKTVSWLPEAAARIERQKTIVTFVDEFFPSATSTSTNKQQRSEAEAFSPARKPGSSKAKAKGKTKDERDRDEEFPALPGSRSGMRETETSEKQNNRERWGVTSAQEEEEEEEEEQVEEENAQVEDEGEAMRAEELEKEKEAERAEEDELFDDLDDVVFRPQPQQPLSDSTASPFVASVGSARLSLSAMSPSPLSPTHGDLLSSMGFAAPSFSGKSQKEFAELDPITQRNTSIWEAIGLGESSGSMFGEHSSAGAGVSGAAQPMAFDSSLSSGAPWTWSSAAGPSVPPTAGPPGLAPPLPPPGLSAVNNKPPFAEESASKPFARSGFLAYLSESR